MPNPESTRPDIIRRTSFVVKDAEASARFYQEVFGWSRFYDNQTPVDDRFPPCAPPGANAHLIILKAEHGDIGMVGFMQYLEHTPNAATDPDKTKLGIGDTILVVEAKDIDKTYERARKAGARLVTEPIKWSVTNYTGDGKIHLCTFSLFDPNGIYVEVNVRL